MPKASKSHPSANSGPAQTLENLIGPHLAELVAEAKRELAALQHAANLDLAPLAAAASAAREAEALLRFGPDQPTHSNVPQADLIAASAHANEAGAALRNASDNRRAANARIALLSAAIGAEAAVQALRSEYESASRAATAAEARRAEIAAALPGMRRKRDELAAHQDDVRRAAAARLTDPAIALDEVLNAEGGADGATVARSLADLDANLNRAEEALAALARHAEAQRGTARELTDRHRRAQAHMVEARWQALVRAAGTLPAEYVAAHRVLYGGRPTFPAVNDLELARALAKIDAGLGPIPSPHSTAEPATDDAEPVKVAHLVA